MQDLQSVFSDFEYHLMNDDKPSIYFNILITSRSIPEEYPFTLLRDLLDVPQSPKHHPEGSVWSHTMLVIDEAAKRRSESKSPRSFMWAAILHDLGKAPTTKLRNGRITSYDHDKVGEKLARDFLSVFTSDEEFISEVSHLVRWHMQILFVLKDLPFANVERMAEETSLDEIGLLSLSDRLGRGDMTEEKAEEEKRDLDAFLDKCRDKLLK